MNNYIVELIKEIPYKGCNKINYFIKQGIIDLDSLVNNVIELC